MMQAIAVQSLAPQLARSRLSQDHSPRLSFCQVLVRQVMKSDCTTQLPETKVNLHYKRPSWKTLKAKTAILPRTSWRVWVIKVFRMAWPSKARSLPILDWWTRHHLSPPLQRRWKMEARSHLYASNHLEMMTTFSTPSNIQLRVGLLNLWSWPQSESGRHKVQSSCDRSKSPSQ